MYQSALSLSESPRVFWTAKRLNFKTGVKVYFGHLRLYRVRMLLINWSATGKTGARSFETLRLFALPPRCLGDQTGPFPFSAPNEIGLVLLHDPTRCFGVLAQGVEEPVPPLECVRIRDVAAPRGVLHRLTLRSGFPEQKPTPFLCSPCSWLRGA